MIINCLSDNNNRATADVAMIVKKAGCNMASSGACRLAEGTKGQWRAHALVPRICAAHRASARPWRGMCARAGSVIFNFARKGRLALTKEIDEDELLELAIEAGVEGDVSVEVRRPPLRSPCAHSQPLTLARATSPSR